MKRKMLGRSRLSISEVSFGCMSLEDRFRQNELLIRTAFENGINFFDTADLYNKGRNEEMLGKALKPVRDQVVIGTKVGNEWKKDGTGWKWNPRKTYILKAVDESLRRLQTDYIDLYQLHGGTIEDPVEETIEAFEELKRQGKIREYGISSIRPNVMREWLKKSGMISVMMQYSLLDRRPEEECLELMKANRVGVLVRGTLAKGLLAGKPPADYLNHPEERVRSLQQYMREHGSLLAQALHFVLKENAVTSAVVGIRTMEQLNALLDAYRTEVPDEHLAELGRSKFAKPARYRQHR